MNRINVTVNGDESVAELDATTGCLRLELIDGTTVTVDRSEVRAALIEQATYFGDQGMWWDGYNSALADAERASAAGKNMLVWVGDVRKKFDLPTQP